MIVAKSKPEGFCVAHMRECYNLKNLIPCASFEQDNIWSGTTYDTSQHLYGSRSSKLTTGGTFVNTVAMPMPIVGHQYYGRHYFKTDGNNTPADCRFEWFAGDGAGLNFVFGWNKGNYSTWHMESTKLTVTVVNGTSYICRNFVVNATANTWCDGLMIIDLTAAFGAGFEPTKEWCDINIPFFEGSYELPVSGTQFEPGECRTVQFVEDTTPRLALSKTKLRAIKFWECVTLTNLLSNGSAENTGWNIGSSASYDSTRFKYGKYSLKVTATASVREVCIYNAKGINCDPSHIYYGRLETYQTTAVGGCNIYWPIAEPSFGGSGNGAANQWNLHSWRVSRTGMASGLQSMRIDFDNNSVAGDCWYDGMMIIDLTAAFGAGFEPTKEWCDINIPFFEGTQDIKFKEDSAWQF